MSTDTTTTAPVAATPAPAATPAKRKGSNITKPTRQRHIQSFTFLRRMKRGIEAFKGLRGVTRITAKEREMIAYFSETSTSQSSRD